MKGPICWRRTAIAVALLATTLATACEGGGEPADRADPAEIDVAFDPHSPTWTVDDTLHTPTASYELGTEVLAYVRTSVGIVFVSGEGDEHVYSFTGDGEPVRIGETSFGGVMLVSDPESPYVGWLQRFGGDGRVVVYDQREGRRVLIEREPADLVAIDGKDVYLRYAFDRLALRRIGNPGTRPVADQFVAAQDGVRAFEMPGKVLVGRALADAVQIGSREHHTAVFAPGAEWVSLGGDDFGDRLSVYDARTGEPRALETDYSGHVTGFEWLDADTLLAWGTDPAFESLRLLQCQVARARCSLVTEQEIDFENGPLVAFADGRSLWATWN